MNSILFSRRRHSRINQDGFFMVAFWQLMSFFMLTLLIWVNEVLDLSALWFNIRPETPNFYRGCGLTIGVMVVAIITVGHTYIQQKRIITQLIVVCSHCRKMRIDETVWAHLDQYLGEHSLARISHGLCPECYEQAKKEVSDCPQHPPKTRHG
ncbi:MAG: hypothetical protein WCI03_07020 [bacterium]|jgi:hypothetical protein